MTQEATPKQAIISKKKFLPDEAVILGIDPGYDRVGWAIGTTKQRKFRCIALGCIQTSKHDPLFLRYKIIQDDLHKIISHFQPNEVAIETLYFSKNKTTALKVSEARGIALGICLQANQAVFEYNPTTIKLAVTGNGSATKDAVEKMVRMQTMSDTHAYIDDAIDAVAIALTHAVSRHTNYLS